MNTLAAKIAKASAEVGGRLKADKKNTNDNYLYISADKVLAECGQALAAQGIAIIPSMTNAEIVQGQTAGGKNRYDGRVSFVMTVTDGETEQTYPWYGFGADYTTPDKAIYKAITSGHKYFLSKLLMIGEGNEYGEHEPSPDVRRQPARQAATNNGNGHGNGAQPAPKPAAQPVEVPPEIRYWEKPEDAYEWAVGVGASDNIFAARNAMKSIVDAHGGRFTKDNAQAIYTAYYHERMARAQEKAKAALETLSMETVPEVDPEGVFN